MNLHFSDDAFEQLIKIEAYISKKWSPQVGQNFLDKIFISTDLIEKNPYIFPNSDNFPGLRKCVVSTLTLIYYRVKEFEKEIEIIVVVDSRQNF